MIRWLRFLSIQNHGKNFEFENDLGKAKTCVKSAESYIVSFILLFGGKLYLTGLPSASDRSKPYMRVYCLKEKKARKSRRKSHSEDECKINGGVFALE